MRSANSWFTHRRYQRRVHRLVHLRRQLKSSPWRWVRTRICYRSIELLWEFFSCAPGGRMGWYERLGVNVSCNYGTRKGLWVWYLELSYHLIELHHLPQLIAHGDFVSSLWGHISVVHLEKRKIKIWLITFENRRSLKRFSMTSKFIRHTLPFDLCEFSVFLNVIL